MTMFLYHFLPIILFFAAFKFYGIYVATIVGIISTAVQVLIQYIQHKKWDKQGLITLVVFAIFGSLTLYFHNPIFVKWKPTIIFWIFSVVLLFMQFFTKQSLIQRMFTTAMQEQKTTVPKRVWKNLNVAWALFFLGLGLLNLYVAYHFSTAVWVNFKLFGTMSLLVIFSVAQALYLNRYLTD